MGIVAPRARLFATALALLASLALAPGSAAAPGSSLERRLSPLLALGVPGAQVDSDGRTAAVGVADRSTRRPMRAGLTFRAGSVTKSFTGAVLLQLVGEGRLELGDTVERWVPGLLPYGDTVDVRSLLQHTSGIPDYWEAGPDPLNIAFVNDRATRAKAYEPRELVERVAREPRDFAPGRRVEYSNTNYVVLGMIIEAATGKPLRREVTKRLIRPLGLRHTRFVTRRKSLPRPFTRGYSNLFDADGLPADGRLVDLTRYQPSALWAMGNIVSNPADLRRFYRALLGGRLLPAPLTRLMKQTRTNQTPEWPEGIGMGLGIWSWELPCGRRVYGHEGEVPGSNTWAFGSADGRRVVVMQQNLLFLNWDRWYDTVMPTYFSFWCRNSKG
jgi:D-alanyl-D-alanine carboxypeptidase